MNKQVAARIVLCVLVTAVMAACGSSQNSSPQVSAQSMAGAPPATTAAAPAHASAVAMCSLDSIDGAPAKNTPMLTIGKLAVFGGWFATSDKQPVGAFKIELTGANDTFDFEAADGVDRSDVVKAIGGTVGAKYGFDASSTLTGAKAGSYTVSLVAPNGERCATKATVSLAD